MTELPKSVREALARAQAPAAPHPDADLLTAYAENSLGATEKQRVTEHVAMCAECREVLFLAQPEPASPQIVAKPAAGRRFGWMAWASVAAVTVVVGSAVVIQHEKVTKIEQPVTVATDTKPADIPSESVEHLRVAPPSSEPKSPAKSQERDQLAVVRRQNKPIALPEPPKPNLARNSEIAAVDEKKDAAGKVGGLVADQAPQNYQSAIGGKQAVSGPAQTANANVTNVYTAQNTAPTAAPMQKARKAEVSREAAAPPTAFGYSQSTTGMMKLQAARAHWRISKAGGLERSFADNDWTPVSVSNGVVFRVISIVGNVVWAGGTNGALYVSRDGGTNWTLIKLDTTADITTIHFDDDVNGKIQTADGKTWKTSDAGNSWTSQ